MSGTHYTFTNTLDQLQGADGYTIPDGINDSGVVTGYISTSTGYEGFIYDNGIYTTVEPSANSTDETVPYAINASGAVTGYFYDSTDGIYSGFIYNNGSFTGFTDPLQGIDGETVPVSINATDAITGYYVNIASDNEAGFIYNNGSFTNLVDPSQSSGGDTVPTAINASGEVTGYYSNGTIESGFLYYDGNFSNFADGAAGADGFTNPVAINASGEVIGTYTTYTTGGNNSSSEDGFVYENGLFTNLVDPLQGTGGETIPVAINESGEVVGYYETASNSPMQSFIYENGTFTNFVDTSQPSGGSTVILGINDEGDLIGYYEDTSGNYEGFIAEVTCFCAGTRIRTIRGDVAVERLAVGDLVITAAGVAPVRWIGRRDFAARFAQANPAIWPVRIAAGALAPNVPKRDLFVSPNHALFLGGALIPAGCLVNGTTITRAAPRDELAYFHIELATHSVIFAEDAPAETYLETGGRAMFHNAATAPEAVASAPFAPLLESGTVVDAVRKQLAARARQLGFDEAPAASLRLTRGLCRMVLDAGVTALTLRSVAGFAPGDRRRLGALIRQIMVDGVPLDLCDAGLQRGFHAPERHGKNTVRWTNGDAVLALPPSGQTRVIDIQVAAVMQTETDAEAA